MYMLRAYQSPYSIADCGPQCAQMPNLASRYQSGACHPRRDSRVPLNGPGAMSSAGPAERLNNLRDDRSAGAAAIMEIALRLLIFIFSILPRSWLRSQPCIAQTNRFIREYPESVHF